MQPVAPNWRTSSYTGTENCVEVADNDPKHVMVQDTKARGRGILAVQRDSWAAFVEYAKEA
ncbi:DUF397 domain-containing protein [Streptomyces sp. NL15-2K]|uniref:DUF397 domain-containing protein n=1 Tax=Streptomyces sp. NL15-2K TaxID=376149 RepID=UPI000F57F950|nr:MULTISPECIES: DUF397 domain-containing protein [Actinomycetes]WKX11169.1 DUF397 domain-containing protein [Kutzneria buriramensis]GCB52287.1 hypothetical protein SNL152K_9643 [Streptomyces sp. NL15-2K]